MRDIVADLKIISNDIREKVENEYNEFRSKNKVFFQTGQVTAVVKDGAIVYAYHLFVYYEKKA